MPAGLIRLDDALIERVFQPLADTIAFCTGLDRLRIARYCLDTASVAWILSQADTLSAAVMQWEVGIAFLRLIVLLLGLAALSSLRALFRRIEGGSGANPLRVAMVWHRCVVLALLAVRLPAVVDFAGAADVAMLLSSACALYLGACTARPPVRRRSGRLAETAAR